MSITDEQLDEWESWLKEIIGKYHPCWEPSDPCNQNSALMLIQALQAERKCNAVLREGLSHLRRLTDDIPMMEILNMELRQIIAKEVETRGEG